MCVVVDHERNITATEKLAGGRVTEYISVRRRVGVVWGEDGEDH